jgi:hypothetical protein
MIPAVVQSTHDHETLRQHTVALEPFTCPHNLFSIPPFSISIHELLEMFLKKPRCSLKNPVVLQKSQVFLK